MLPGANKEAPSEPLNKIWMHSRYPSDRSQKPTVKHLSKSRCSRVLEWTLSKLIHVPDFFCSRSHSSISGCWDQHDGSWHSGDHIANLPILENTCVLWSIFCSESGCLGLQIKCSYWESQPANLYARKWSHLMSRGEAIGGCMSPEQLEICFLNKSALVWSLWAAWVESLFSTTISIALFLFSGLIKGTNAESATYRYDFRDFYLSKAIYKKFWMLSEGKRITLHTGKLQFAVLPVNLAISILQYWK